MKFGDITSAVHDAWLFFWPPLLACVIAYSVAIFIYPTGVQGLSTQAGLAVTQYGDSLEEIRKAIEPFGITPLIPLLSLIGLIAFLYLVSIVSMVWSDRLPPHLSYQPERLLIDWITEKEKLLLFRKYPTAEDFNNAFRMAMEDARQKDNDQEMLPSRAENYYKLHYFVKFAVAVAGLTLILAARSGDASLDLFGRVLVVAVASAVIWALGLIGLLYAQEQDFYREWSATKRAILQEDTSKLLKKDATPEEEEKLSMVPKGRWWRVYAFDPYRVNWFKRTFLERPVKR
jgi:hypothetical protein